MTIHEALIWSICRAAFVASLALIPSLLIYRWCFRSRQGSVPQRIWILLALMPLFVPDLLIGFTYRLTSARLLHSNGGTEALYALLLLIRVIAFQFAVRCILPRSAISPESLFTWRLCQTNTVGWWTAWGRMLSLGPWRAAVIAWLGSSLICFQEFETAALIQINQHPISWTVWLYDAHTVGESLVTSLKYVSWALVLQAVFLVPAIILACSTNGVDFRERNTVVLGHSRPVQSVAAVCFLALAVIAFLIWPVAGSRGQLMGGLSSLVDQGNLSPRLSQIVISLVASSASSILALWIVSRLHAIGSGSLTLLILMPGLCGSLVLGMMLLALFQLPGLNLAYDTWLPMLLGQTLLLLPRAWLLLLVGHVLTDQSSVHSAKMLLRFGSPEIVDSGNGLLWRFLRLKWFLAAAILTHWSFWDVSVVSMLRPVAFEPVVIRLYNEMHFGRTDTLIALTWLSVIVPLLILLLIGFQLKHSTQQKAVADV